ncbi:MAG: class I SAM-dependent methyltransferase [Deltaproteobacteria bacterium]|nr:class I SAM-dependent methyltransferase [Deltaproteobacteria bacterium]
MSGFRELMSRLFRPFFWALALFFPGLVTEQTWNREYRRGQWDLLDSQEQLGHTLIVLGHVINARERSRILEIGCGPGRLQQLLQRVGFESYLGIDISSEAISRARELNALNSAFQVTDARTFCTDERFDVIIFNEVAYYFERPVEVLLRYAEFLREDGAIVISMFDFVLSRIIWRKIDRVFTTLDLNTVKNRKGQKWQIRLLSKKPI